MAISCSRHLQNYPELYPELFPPVRDLGSGTRSSQIHNFQELFSIISQGRGSLTLVKQKLSVELIKIVSLTVQDVSKEYSEVCQYEVRGSNSDKLYEVTRSCYRIKILVFKSLWYHMTIVKLILKP